MLHTALWNAKKVMQSVAPFLFDKEDKYPAFTMESNEEQAKPNDVASTRVLDTLEVEEIALVVYNSLTRPRTEVCYQSIYLDFKSLF